jgi:hypothetical protein
VPPQSRPGVQCLALEQPHQHTHAGPLVDRANTLKCLGDLAQAWLRTSR